MTVLESFLILQKVDFLLFDKYGIFNVKTAVKNNARVNSVSNNDCLRDKANCAIEQIYIDSIYKQSATINCHLENTRTLYSYDISWPNQALFEAISINLTF